MNAELLLDELAGLGIQLEREREAIFADVKGGAEIEPYAALIKEHKPAILAALRLREQIVAAVNVEPHDFNRSEYEALWVRWHTENAKEESPR